MTNYIKKGNIKTGEMGTISKLMGNHEIFIEKLNLKVLGTCGLNCTGCETSCYVRKSYRYPSVKYSHAITTLAFRNDIENAFSEMDKQLTRKRKKFEIVRINQSGEIETDVELQLYNELAKKHPETIFYLYTKNYSSVFKLVLNGKIQENLFINISIWGLYGIKEYKRLKQLSNQIRAFVCITKEYTVEWYAKHGIIIQSYCTAYNENGKLNHERTCNKCRLCFNHCTDITGCYEH